MDGGRRYVIDIFRWVGVLGCCEVLGGCDVGWVVWWGGKKM